MLFLPWFKICNRGNRTCPSNLVINRNQSRKRLFGFEFIRNSPTRRFCSKSQSLLLIIPINLYYHTINIERKLFSFFIPKIDEFENLRKIFAFFHLCGNFKPPVPGLVQILIMRFERKVVSQKEIKKTIQRTFGYDCRILNLKGSRCSISGIWNIPFGREGNTLKVLCSFSQILHVEEKFHRESQIFWDNRFLSVLKECFESF